MDRKIYWYIFVGVIVILLLGFFLLSEDPEPRTQSNEASAAALALLAGGGDGGGRRGGSTTGSGGSADGSLFDSDFWRSGEPDQPIVDSRRGRGDGMLSSAHPDNPINPETGEPFTDSVMEQFESMHERFPDNTIIPRRRSAEEIAEEQAERQQMFELQGVIAQQRGTPDQVNQFYDWQSRRVRDRLEILEYAIVEQGDTMPPDFKERYDEIRLMNQRQLDAYEAARRRALRAIGVDDDVSDAVRD